jgi:superfamily II DNA/RNA helicase
VKGIELVLNYDLPQHPENYVHRIGRTGRIGGIGHAISFATPDQKSDVRGIERLIRATLPLSALPQMPPARMSLNVPKKPAIIAPKPAVPGGQHRHYRHFNRVRIRH